MTPAQWFERYPITEQDILDTNKVVSSNLEMGRDYLSRASDNQQRSRISQIMNIEQATWFEMRLHYASQH